MDNRRRGITLLLAGLMIGCGIGLLGILVAGEGAKLINQALASRAEQTILVPEVNSPALDFELEKINGESVRLSDYRGHIVLVNFWATWCEPCREEMPVLEKYYEKNSPDLVILGVNAGEPLKDVQSYIQDKGFMYDILLDPGEKIEDLYRIRGFPTTIIIDKDGIIRFQHIGILEESRLKGYLQKVGFEK